MSERKEKGLIGQEDELAKVKKIQPGIAELRDGVTLEWLETHASWILEAEIKDAVVGKEGSDLVWYYGTWRDGVWEDGTWKFGVCAGGRWKGGTWKGGYWYYGIWEDGIWEDGVWEDGTWKGGTWKGGYDRNDNYHSNPPSEWGGQVG